MQRGSLRKLITLCLSLGLLTSCSWFPGQSGSSSSQSFEATSSQDTLSKDSSATPTSSSSTTSAQSAASSESSASESSLASSESSSSQSSEASSSQDASSQGTSSKEGTTSSSSATSAQSSADSSGSSGASSSQSSAASSESSASESSSASSESSSSSSEDSSPIVYPEYVQPYERLIPDKNIWGDTKERILGCLAMDLTALGYQTIEYGGFLIYTDYSSVYNVTREENGKTITEKYVEAAFVQDYFNESHPEYVHMAPSFETFLVNQNGEAIIYIDAFRMDKTIHGHFIHNGDYVDYRLLGDVVYTDLVPTSRMVIDRSLGPVYDFDEHEYYYVPFDMIPDYDPTFVETATEIDPKSISKAFDDMRAYQEAMGYQEESTYVAFISKETYNLLRGGGTTIDGIAFEAMQSVDFNPEKEYLTLNPDGSIGVSYIPPLSAEKTLKDWITDAIVIGGGLTVAVVLTVSTFGGSSLLSGAIFGAVSEYASQAIIERKTPADMNWAKVFSGAVFGMLMANIPLPTNGKNFAKGLVSSAFLGGAEKAVNGIIDGNDVSTILGNSLKGAVYGAAVYGARTVLSKVTGKVEKVGSSKKRQEAAFVKGNAVVIDDQPTIVKIKNELPPTFNLTQKISNAAQKTSWSKSINLPGGKELVEQFSSVFGL